MRNPVTMLRKWYCELGEKPRSPLWPKVRLAELKVNPDCAACGSTLNCEVHHIKSFKDHPELELCNGTGQYGTPVGPSNFITLCERMGKEDHLHFGHCRPDGTCSWMITNPNVREDAAKALAALKAGKP